MYLRYLLPLFLLVLAGCSSNVPPPSGRLSDSIFVVSQLQEQQREWYRTPYRYGGLSRDGVDCSGFVYKTFHDRFDINLPRTTKLQAEVGSKIPREELKPGDLVFFKTNQGENGLHVGIYNTKGSFIHASTNKGVITSSLDSSYWKNAYWQSRRL
ncbi:MAG: C40 family peptidase [Enterobacteriaceae bacterium]|jgi:probable lipoprotein NlpC|nr:C40 family peptidase [Enterobacteriaceae bacterium]